MVDDTALVQVSPSEMTSLALKAGLEIDKSRFSDDIKIEIVRKFGRTLEYGAIGSTLDGRKSFSNPSYASPLRRLYLSNQGASRDTSMEDVIKYWSGIAKRLEAFGQNTPIEEKVLLADICSDLYRQLSGASYREQGFDRYA